MPRPPFPQPPVPGPTAAPPAQPPAAEQPPAGDEARRAAAAWSGLLASMSQEIRTPMNGVQGMLELLAETPLTPEQRDYTATARRSAEALLAVVSDVVDFARAEAGRLELDTTDVHVRATVEEVAEGLAERAAGRGLELATWVDPALPPLLRGDGARIRQVLRSLADNAVRFTEQGEVCVRVHALPGHGERAGLRVEVSDTGVGIAPGALAGLLHAFPAGGGTPGAPGGGLGLGLALARRLVERMGGRLGVESTPGAGSTFWFELALEASGEAPPAEPRVQLAGQRLLVVWRPGAPRELLVRGLRRWGADCATADSPADAAALLADRADDFDAVVLDVPAGAEATELVGRAGVGLLPLLLLTPVGEHVDATGAVAEVHKPLRAASLARALAELLDAPAAGLPWDDDEAGAAPHPAHSARAGRILLAEDNAVNQKVAVTLLERLGHFVQVAANGREAVEAVRAGRFDLVLMDCRMPEMDGFEATREIRRLEGRRHTRIVAMTGNAVQGDRERCLEAGMDDYLAKPVQREQLYEAVERWIPALPEALTSAEPGAAAQPPVLDPAALAFLTGGDRAATERFLRLFVETTRPLLRDVADAVAGRDAGALRLAGHTLRGSAATVGALRMAELGERLEALGDAPDWPGAERLRVHLVRSLHELEALQEEGRTRA